MVVEKTQEDLVKERDVLYTALLSVLTRVQYLVERRECCVLELSAALLWEELEQLADLAQDTLSWADGAAPPAAEAKVNHDGGEPQ